MSKISSTLFDDATGFSFTAKNIEPHKVDIN